VDEVANRLGLRVAPKHNPLEVCHAAEELIHLVERLTPIRAEFFRDVEPENL